MKSVYDKTVNELDEALLIYEVGFSTYINNPNYSLGVSPYRINKTVSAILRHWHHIRNSSDDFIEIVTWNLKHAPYRYGEVIYKLEPQPVSSKLSPHPVPSILFLDKIITQNITLKKLGVRYEGGFHEESRIFFPAPNPLSMGKFRNISKIEMVDYELIRLLATLYATASSDVISILSTCPTNADCIKAMKAEISLWFHDMDKVFTYFKPEMLSFQHELQIKSSLKSAFNAGREIVTKRKWYSEIQDSFKKIVEIGIRLGITSEIINPLYENIGDGVPSEEVCSIEKAAEILIAFLGFIGTLFSHIGTELSLPEPYIQISSRYLNRLQDVGITKKDVNNLYLFTSSKPNNIMEILLNLEHEYQLIRDYFSDRYLPFKYELSDLFEIENI